MNVIRNIQMDLNRFRSRVFVVTFVILIALGVLFLRLFYLQVIRYDELNAAAESNRTAIVPIVASSWTATEWCWQRTIQRTR
jgi:penicillin-binding protein 2